MSPQERIKRGIARSFQLVALYDKLSVLDNIRIAILSRTGKTRKIFSLLENDGVVREEALQLLEMFGLTGKEHLLPTSISHGDRKLLDVCIAFALNPKLIMLDEPTSGVSRREKMAIMDKIVSIMHSKSVATILVEHDMDVVFNYSERVVVMHEGKIMFEGKPKEVKEDNEVKRVLLGE